MTEPNISSPPTPPASGRSWNRRSGLKIVGLVLISAVAGAAISQAARHMHFRHHGPHSFMSGQMDPADIDRRVEWMTGRLAKDVNATADQREKLSVVAKAAAKDLLPLRETMQQARKQAQDLLGQATVDRAAIEKLRSDQMANVDTMSKRVSAALADAAEILSPEQRRQLAERFPPHKGWWGGRDRG